MGEPNYDALIQAAKAQWVARWEDRELVAIGVEQGIPWLIGPGGHYGLCGYALVPAEGHPWSPRWPNGIDAVKDQEHTSAYLRLMHELHEKGWDLGAATEEAERQLGPHNREYMDDFISCHGGVTYYRHPWIGFDTMHSGDIWDGTPWEEKPYISARTGETFTRATESALGLPWAKQWSLELICEEAKDLAKQVAEVANLERAIEMPTQEEIDEAGRARRG